MDKKGKSGKFSKSKEKAKKYEALQKRIFDFAQKHNLHVIMTDMMNKSFLNNEKNPTLFMANYLLTLNNSNVEQHCLGEMNRLRSELRQYKQREVILMQENELLNRRIEALSRATGLKETSVTKSVISMAKNVEQSIENLSTDTDSSDEEITEPIKSTPAFHSLSTVNSLSKETFTPKSTCALTDNFLAETSCDKKIVEPMVSIPASALRSKKLLLSESSDEEMEIDKPLLIESLKSQTCKQIEDAVKSLGASKYEPDEFEKSLDFFHDNQTTESESEMKSQTCKQIEDAAKSLGAPTYKPDEVIKDLGNLGVFCDKSTTELESELKSQISKQIDDTAKSLGAYKYELDQFDKSLDVFRDNQATESEFEMESQTCMQIEDAAKSLGAPTYKPDEVIKDLGNLGVFCDKSTTELESELKSQISKQIDDTAKSLGAYKYELDQFDKSLDVFRDNQATESEFEMESQTCMQIEDAAKLLGAPIYEPDKYGKSLDDSLEKPSTDSESEMVIDESIVNDESNTSLDPIEVQLKALETSPSREKSADSFASAALPDTSENKQIECKVAEPNLKSNIAFDEDDFVPDYEDGDI